MGRIGKFTGTLGKTNGGWGITRTGRNDSFLYILVLLTTRLRKTRVCGADHNILGSLFHVICSLTRTVLECSKE